MTDLNTRFQFTEGRFEEILSLALEASEAGIWNWEISSGRIIWSEQMEKLYGLEPKSFSGAYEDFMAMVHPEDRSHLQSVVENAIRTKKPYKVEHRVIWPDGSVHWLLGKGQAFFDSQGSLIRMTGTSSEITDRKQQEELLKLRNSELEKFSAIVAHDLKAPLNSLSQLSDLLAEKFMGHDPEGDQFFKLMENSTDRLRNLIDSLLLFARAGNIPAETFQWNELPELISEVKINLQAVILESGAQIHESSPSTRIFGNRVQLIQLLQNLIGNAIKYRHPERAPVIEVSCRESEDQWHIAVKDNGRGIPAKDFIRIFDFFQRVDENHRVEGTGLGLAICQKIAKAHGAVITVESEIGKGSSFHITFKKH